MMETCYDMSGNAFVVKANAKDYKKTGRLMYKCPLCKKYKIKHGKGYELGRTYHMIDTCAKCYMNKKYQTGSGFIGKNGFYVKTDHLMPK